MVSKARLTKISDRIREELSEILLLKSNDPRIKGVTITDVEVDRELAYAEVYVCALEGAQRSQEILSGLEHAQGYLRSELAHRLELRMFPKLRFHWDPTFEHADQIEKLLISIHEMDTQATNHKKKKAIKK